MRYLPVCLDVQDRPCLLVGGGGVATRKGELLAKAGAQLHVVAPEITLDLQALAKTFHVRGWQPEDLEGKALVVVATSDQALNQRISLSARQQGIPVNVVDQPHLCTVIFPSIIDRDPLLISVSSSGGAPVLTRMIREKIETLIPKAYGALARMAGEFRDQVKQKIPHVSLRRKFWESVLSGPVVEQVLAQKNQSALRLLEQSLETFVQKQETLSSGEVYLVGGGPGDPELLTFRALRLMQQADVVIYDRLVSSEVLDLVRRDARKVYAGKKRDEHTLPQQEINRRLIEYARAGQRVCRLKGGDPFIFGRGGEEIEELMEAGIPFQVVPGITAASGCAAYAGIPLTHRDYAQSVRFVTGHMKEGTLNLAWDRLICEHETLVFYMGLVSLPVICEQLIKHGTPESRPVALIGQGTTREQRVVTGVLKNFAGQVSRLAEPIQPPALLIVGDVVKLHKKLAWFGNDNNLK